MNQKNQKQKIQILTNNIKLNWKKSVHSLIEIGRCLNQLKAILKRPQFITHIDKHFSMNEMQAHRLINLYLKFHDKKSLMVLSSKPSVLYLMASTLETKKLESLAKGGKVLVGRKYKTITQLTIADIHAIKEKTSIEKIAFDIDENKRDIDRAKTAHRRFASFVEEISDWANDLERYQKCRMEIENKALLKKYLEETIECLINLKPLLM